MLQELQDNSFKIAALNCGVEIFCDAIFTKKIDPGENSYVNLGYLYASKSLGLICLIKVRECNQS